MKTGILTFHRALNYGAFLQALALKNVIGSLGDEVFFIDYWPEAHERAYKHSRTILLSLLKPFQDRAFRKCLPMLGVGRKPEFRDGEGLSGIDCNRIVFGSDQIWWNSIIKGYEGVDEVYFGKGFRPDIKRIAYAPSIGRENEASLEAVKEYCASFSALSARESSLASILSDISGKDVPVVLDPVLLAGRDFWEKVRKPCHIRGEYIAYYRLMANADADLEAERLHRETGLPVIRFSGGVDSYRHLETLGMDPLQFVSIIRNARHVVSTSFHGVAFSILFNKAFYFPTGLPGASRVASLMEVLGIENPASYDCGEALETLRADSLSYLKTALDK